MEKTIAEISEFIKANSDCKLVSERYVNGKRKLLLECRCGDLFEVAWNSFRSANKRQCNKCAGRPNHTIKDVGKWVSENSGIELLSTEYTNARALLKFKCTCGKEFERSFDNLKRKKSTLCRSCASVKAMPEYAKKKIGAAQLKPIEIVIDLVENKMKCKFIKRYTKLGTRSTVIVFECPTHGAQEAFWTNLEKRKGCPLCNEHNKQNSKHMLQVEKWFSENGILFEKEVRFKECKDKRPLPFDYYIPARNTCVEVDGRQHYEKAYFGNIDEETSEKVLQYTRKHDEIKNKYCLENSINLIRIPYYETDIEKTLKSIL